MAGTRETLDQLLAAQAELYTWGAELSGMLERVAALEIDPDDRESVAGGLRLSLTAVESARSAREQLSSLRLIARRLLRAVSSGLSPDSGEVQTGTSTTQGECLEVYTDPFGDVLGSLLERIDDLADTLTEFVDHLRGEVLDRRSDDSAPRRAAAIVRGQELAKPVLSGLIALRTVATGLRAYLGR